MYSLFHYTKTEAFANMVNGNDIWLSRVDQMNDGTEDFDGADRTYVFSFSFARTESAGMWIAYGLPRQQAIRVRFPGKELFNICHGNDGRVEVFPIKNDKAEKRSIRAKASLHCVGYVSNAGQRIHVRRKIFKFSEIMAKSPSEIMSLYKSYIKLLGWEYEQEIRLVVTLDEKSDAKKIQLNMPTVIEKILRYKPCKRNGSNGMPSVIVGPWSDRDAFVTQFKTELEKKKCPKRDDVRYFLDQKDDVNGLIRESEFKGKIRLGRCAGCVNKCSGNCTYYEGIAK